MSDLYLMMTIARRAVGKKMSVYYENNGLSFLFGTLGHGTAGSEVLDYLGLEATEKAVLLSVVTGEMWKKLKKGLEGNFRIDVPGTGIACIMPLSSIGGRKLLQFVTDGQNYEIGEESVMKDTKYELIVVIANSGYSDLVMDAAREKGAGGGTVIHAKGTGLEKAEKFLGVSIAGEKDMIFIVARASEKSEIMKSVIDQAGLRSKAGAVAFSVPVSDTAGLRLQEIQ